MHIAHPVLTSLCVCQALAGQDISPRDLAALARPSVVVVTGMKAGRPASRGSGFLVSADGRLVTNRHVLEGADALQVELASGEIYDNVFLIADDVRRDLAVLRIPGTNLPHVTIAGDDEIAVGDPIYVMGNPKGWDGTFTSGIVSAKRLVDGVSLLQISAPISPGSSGGPVFNSRGRVVGVATFVVEDAQNLNMAVPARYAMGMISVASPPRPFAEVAHSFMSSAPSDDQNASASDPQTLEPWAMALAEDARRVRMVADSLGLVESHKPRTDILDQGKLHEIKYTFAGKGDVINIAGVCDLDCSNLNLGVYDLAGKEIVKDVSASDRPVVTFTVLTPGTFLVRVLMRSCSTEQCAYTLQTFIDPKRR